LHCIAGDIVKPSGPVFIACLALAATPAPGVMAQALPAQGQSPAASAPDSGRPVRRALTPEELRESASFPGELRPAGPATPQIRVPLGQKPPTRPTSPTAAAARAAHPAQAPIQAASQAASEARASALPADSGSGARRPR